MSCATPALLAEAATLGPSPELLAHAESCGACAGELAAQQQMRALLGALPALPLSGPRRESAITAAMMIAEADIDDRELDVVPRPARGRIVAAGIALVALAAVVALVVGRRTQPMARVAIGELPRAPAVILPAPSPTPISPEAPSTMTATISGDGEYSHEESGDHDVIRVTRGSVTIDAIHARPIVVITGSTSVTLRETKAEVIVTHGAVASVHVFAGSAEIATGTGSTKRVVETTTLWERPTPPPADPVGAFRDGWSALRAGKNVEAIAAFDRATDPSVAEDALYWSAVAAERAKHVADAIRRYSRVLAKFPDGERAADAQTALGRLAPE